MNATLEILTAHRSIRKFTDEPLPDGLLETLCTAAQAAATSSFLQGAT
ncbi:MAG: nitroreductase family protein, partial [OM182 bacterium]|nr:nitroreductase family protein [OM182 bacterium]